MSTLLIGAAAGYVMGAKAGRKRYHQIRKTYEFAVNSPLTRAAITTGRKVLANKLDPEPRMRELSARETRAVADTPGQTLLVPDED